MGRVIAYGRKLGRKLIEGFLPREYHGLIFK